MPNQPTKSKSKTSSPAEKAHARIQERMRCIKLVQKGVPVRKISQTTGVSPRAIAYWKVRFKKHGLAGLTGKRPPGRRSRLDARQLTHLRSVVRRALHAGESVHAQSLSEYIKKKYDVKIALRQCWRILARLRIE